MLNAVGREIPEEILERTGKEVFQGNNYKDGKAFQKASPKVTPVMRNDHDKMVKDIHEALVKCITGVTFGLAFWKALPSL